MNKILMSFLTIFFVSGFIFALGIYTNEKYTWGEQLGWINFGVNSGNVNVEDDKLTGYAWSDNYGWINLSPTSGGVLNDGNGNLSGNAWGEQIGWINFSGVTINEDGYFSGTASTESKGNINFTGENISLRTYWNSKKAPNDIGLSGNIINENNSINDLIGVLATTDINTSDTHSYSLACQNSGVDDIFFNINSNQLRASNVFDYEIPVSSNSNNNYNICIRTTDNSGLFFDKNFTVRIANLYDAVNLNTNNCLSHDLQDFAWSDGIGWISFDCKSLDSYLDYGVNIDRNGYLSGYAWSDGIGWISFDYYNSLDSRPKYNNETKKLEGYVKALSGLNDDDGWNGKISLSGLSSNGYSYAPVYNATSQEFDEYAWGDEFVGWIDFKTEYAAVTMDAFYMRFTSNRGTGSDPIPAGGNVVLSWITEGAVSCTASNGQGTTWTNNSNKIVGEPSSASETVSDLIEDITVTLTCRDIVGNEVEKNIDLRVAPPEPSLFLSIEDDNIPSNTSTKITWNVENVENCVASSSSNTWTGNKNSSNGVHEGQTGNLVDSSNWFKLRCDSENQEYYPAGIEKTIYVDVEKLTLEFYPETSVIKFNDYIKLYWIPEFADSCVATGDLINFNGVKNSSEGRHSFTNTDKEPESARYNIKMKCVGTIGQILEKDLELRVGKNPIYIER